MRNALGSIIWKQNDENTKNVFIEKPNTGTYIKPNIIYNNQDVDM